MTLKWQLECQIMYMSTSTLEYLYAYMLECLYAYIQPMVLLRR